MSTLIRGTLHGVLAGAAGTTVLNAVTYADMAVRGRPASSTPGDTVEALAAKTGVPVPGAGEERDNRIAGLGPLLGIAAGVGAGALLGIAMGIGWRPGPASAIVAASAAALLAGNAPMTLLGVTDPREWPASAWVADIVPHVAYGVAAAAVLRRRSAFSA